LTGARALGADFRASNDHIEEENPAAADFEFEALIAVAASLPDHLYVYREGRKPNTREMVAMPNYIILCRVKHDRVQIVNVLHARRRYP